MMRVMLVLSLLLILPIVADAERLDALSGNLFKINPAQPPNGTQIMQILLENASIPLKDTPCGNGASDKRTIQHQLARMLGESLKEKRLKSVISGRCRAEQFEFADGVKDIWMCGVAVVDTDKKGEFISSVTVDFGVTKDTWKFIPELFMCTA